MVEELRALAARALVKATHGGTSAALRAAGYPEDVCEQVAGQEQCIHFSPAANCRLGICCNTWRGGLGSGFGLGLGLGSGLG